VTPRRRLALLASLLLIVVAASLTAQRDRAEQAVAPPPEPATRPAATVAGTLPDDRTIRARPGDLVRLTVRSGAVAEVRIDALGVSGVATPEEPALLELAADEPGRHPVLVDDGADRRVGTLVIAAPDREDRDAKGTEKASAERRR